MNENKIVIGKVLRRVRPYWGRLILSLLLTLAAEIAALLLGYRSPALSWIGVGLFSMYIGYDWHRAQQGTKTVYHAIDCAVDLYLDITNLFLDLLELLDWSDLLD